MSKVERSRYRQQIDEMLEQGRSTREISRWLAQQDPPERIHYTAIARYNQQRITRIQEELSAQIGLRRAVEQRLTAVEAIDVLLDHLTPILRRALERVQTALSDPDASLRPRDIAQLGKLLVELHRLRDEKTGDAPGTQGLLTFEDAVRLLAEGGLDRVSTSEEQQES